MKSVADAVVEKAYGGSRQIRWMEIYAGVEWQEGTPEAKKVTYDLDRLMDGATKLSLFRLR